MMMKTIEEKAKAYDEAVAYAKRILDGLAEDYRCTCMTKDDIKNQYSKMFPHEEALNPSEDDRIIRCLKEIVEWGCSKNIMVKCGVDLKAVKTWLEKQKEQKPAEVEQNPLVRMLKDKKAITEDIRNGIPIKTIEKERNVKFATPVDVSHTEWNEEDIEASVKSYSDSLPMCGEFQSYHDALVHAYRQGVVNTLKSLPPSWKPSEEQMEELCAALTPGATFDCDILNELYEQLKKLM